MLQQLPMKQKRNTLKKNPATSRMQNYFFGKEKYDIDDIPVKQASKVFTSNRSLIL